MICPHCGNQLPKKGEFCVFCGEKIDIDKAEGLNQQETAENQAADTQAADTAAEFTVAESTAEQPENADAISANPAGQQTTIIPPLVADTGVAERYDPMAEDGNSSEKMAAEETVAEEDALTEKAADMESAETVKEEFTENVKTKDLSEVATAVAAVGAEAAMAEADGSAKKSRRRRRRRSKKNVTQVFPKVDNATTQVMPGKEELEEADLAEAETSERALTAENAEAANLDSAADAENENLQEISEPAVDNKPDDAYYEAEADAILRKLDGIEDEEDISGQNDADMDFDPNAESEYADAVDAMEETPEAEEDNTRQTSRSRKRRNRKKKQKARRAAEAAAAAAVAGAELTDDAVDKPVEEILADPLTSKDSYEYMTNTYDLDVDLQDMLNEDQDSVEAILNGENPDDKAERYERLVTEDKRAQARHHKMRHRQRNQRMVLGGVVAAIVVLAIILGTCMFRYNKTKENVAVADTSAVSKTISTSPTVTPTVKPTTTPKATATPTPTETPEVTEEPTPEVTEEPTSTPTPTPTPTEAPEEEEYDEEEETYYDNSYVIPNSSSEYLSDDDVNWMSAGDLRLARNEIYARHGQTFESDDLQAYFDNQEWYTPIYAPGSLTFNDLSDVERANIQLIQSYE